MFHILIGALGRKSTRSHALSSCSSMSVCSKFKAQSFLRLHGNGPLASFLFLLFFHPITSSHLLKFLTRSATVHKRFLDISIGIESIYCCKQTCFAYTICKEICEIKLVAFVVPHTPVDNHRIIK